MTEPLVRWRAEFPIVDTCTYLVSHSLGAMPGRARTWVQAFAETWMTRGVRAWSEGWWELGRTVGDLLAPIIGAPPGSVSMHQNASVAQAIIGSCFTFRGRRRKIVLTDLEFPTNIYLFGGFRRYGAELVIVPSADGVRTNLDRLLQSIDEETVLVPLSLVLFRSSYIQDAAAVIEKAHRVGAHVILDIYQAAGVIPVDVRALGADFAVGGSVKWLCGGPGAGYLYVRPDLAGRLEPGFVGWAAHASPFTFEAAPIRYAPAPERFQSGTPNVLALYAARAGYEIVREIGVHAIREHSLRLTRLMIDRARAAGFRINTPDSDAERAGAVIVDVPDGEGVTRELLRREVIVDYRPGAGIRMSPHFYTSEADVEHAMDTLGEIAGSHAPASHGSAGSQGSRGSLPISPAPRPRRLTLECIAVLGAGTMGHGIAHAAMAAGYETRLYDVDAAALERGRSAIDAIVRRGVELGKIDAPEAKRVVARLTISTDLAAALDGADLVIEAAPERIDLKLALFADVQRLAPARAVIASNTSALSITELAGSLDRPSRAAGMHFFNPVPQMKLIEIVRALETSADTLSAIEEVARRMGKETVVVRESPGFITTRVNAGIGNEAFYMLMEGVASARDIDKALKLGLNHPMGPFELVDLVGLDTRLSILQYLHQSLGEKFRPCPLLVQYVKAGRLGKKSGKGVYEY
jgi:kynureninase